MAHLLGILKNTIELVKQSYFTFWGVAGNAALFYIALLYILHVLKGETIDKKQDKAILWLVAVVSFVILCPLSAWFIMKYCVESAVYRRMFWMLPVSLLIGYAGTRFLFQEQSKGHKWITGLVMAAIIAVSGGSMYSNGAFGKAENPYKLWNGIPQVCDALLEDARENDIEEIRVIGGADEFAVQARQYSADIHMPYGRNGIRGEKMGKRATQIYETLHEEEGVNAQALAFYAKQGNYQYLVYYNREDSIPVFESAGYEWLMQVEEYYIYKLNPEKVSDILVTQYGKNDGNQLMFYTIETMEGKLMIVDGGFEADEEYVRTILEQKGNKVDAWILTHFHQDHIGAFCKIYENPQKIKIKKIYTIDMAPLELCVENAPWDETYTYERFMDLNVEVTKYLYAGDKLKIAGVPIRVYNAYDDYVDKLSNDLHNDGSLMFQISGKTEKMLFCSDVGKGMSDYLLEKYGKKLQSDYLQMGHHGNGGLKGDFYKKVDPKVAFFDAPAWLFDNMDGTYTSAKNREIIRKIGAEVYSFDGTPHSIQLH